MGWRRAEAKRRRSSANRTEADLNAPLLFSARLGPRANESRLEAAGEPEANPGTSRANLFPVDKPGTAESPPVEPLHDQLAEPGVGRSPTGSSNLFTWLAESMESDSPMGCVAFVVVLTLFGIGLVLLSMIVQVHIGPPSP
jgi:hypothetical protein